MTDDATRERWLDDGAAIIVAADTVGRRQTPQEAVAALLAAGWQPPATPGLETLNAYELGRREALGRE